MGNCKRDFTYIDDIVEGVSKVMCAAPERRNGADGLPVPPYAIIILVIVILKISLILYVFFQRNWFLLVYYQKITILKTIKN